MMSIEPAKCDLTLKAIPMCCGRNMRHEKDAFGFQGHELQCEFFICFECGHFITLKEEVLDEEELDNYVQSYGIDEDGFEVRV